MKKVIFSAAMAFCSMLSLPSKAQVSVAVAVGVPVYYPQPKVAMVVPICKTATIALPKRIVIAPVRPVAVVTTAPLSTVVAVRKSQRRIIIYR